MKSLKNGSNILAASVENITPQGLWMLINEKEYFLSYSEFPYFEDATIKDIHNVKLLHGFHLRWEDLDVDLDMDCISHPEKFPLISKLNMRNQKNSMARKAA
jgi:hypothetical protein